MHMATRDTTGRDGDSSIPDDLMASREALNQFHIPYSTLMGWWNRGVIRRWKRGMFNLVSAAEVAQAVERFQTIREIPPPYASKDSEADSTGEPS